MRIRGQARAPIDPLVSRRAQISAATAVKNLIYLLFARVSDKVWFFVILSLALIGATGYREFTPTLVEGFPRLEVNALPILTQTLHSPDAAKITDEELFGERGLVNTPSGTFEYSRKLRVFATSYDKTCKGCNETTALGLKTGFGVVAVDPKVIPLGSKVYIPGYGVAVAGDTGGAIKGDKIDLGFDDIKRGWWKSRFVEVYILR